jgi:antitoxin VapB
VLSNKPGARIWNEFFGLLHTLAASDAAAEGFMSERPLNVLPAARGIFDAEIEA